MGLVLSTGEPLNPLRARAVGYPDRGENRGTGSGAHRAEGFPGVGGLWATPKWSPTFPFLVIGVLRLLYLMQMVDCPIKRRAERSLKGTPKFRD